ncbi:2Fe-2S iron-sulfur cluster-binding protein [Rhodovulum visakhapatnamense]|uniref:2Fe-2S iron-sulfur cluster protein n=1 Tax=Rhodovulum visakhapatnamense TaxID=364297 RepID=A0A4R8FPE4_9RHOB|nr:2Fe-2S iron-sulfur cluster-binding protein [Rhodovulum visakhapatnamense]TDX28278.1 2Fe-2S iron-sulfur cluster protein [Rhodovulum visakhapatnamense]
MKTVSTFLSLEAPGPRVRVWLDGAPLHLPHGANLAAALLAAGVNTFRGTACSGAPRAPYCMMGACFDCMIEVEGETRQACLLEVAEDMRLTRPGAPGDA